MQEFSYTERHMGTVVSVSFICASKDQADYLAQSAFTTIHEFELRFSRFLPDSELSRLNQTKSMVMSDIFISVLRRSIDLATLTKQAFNPLIQVAHIGYQTNFEDLPQTSTVTDYEYSTDLSTIRIDSETNQVTLGPEQKLDFGGVLKGYLAAFLADDFMETHHYCRGCIINIGGDLATRGKDELHEPFIFFLYNPITGAEIPLAIKDRSLATSGTYARRWNTNQGYRHHIVDSTSCKNPTEDIAAVSIITKDGALSEALTKLFLTKGISAAQQTASPEHYHYKYFVVTNTGNVISNIV